MPPSFLFSFGSLSIAICLLTILLVIYIGTRMLIKHPAIAKHVPENLNPVESSLLGLLALLLAFELLGTGVKTWQADVLGLLLVVVGVGSALLLHEATRRNALRFLFDRPAWARLVSGRSGAAVARGEA